MARRSPTPPPRTRRPDTRSPDRPAVEVTGLVKTYGDVRALNGLDLTVPQGGVYAVLGPNGAGKTTAIRVLTTLTRPDAGRARVLGHDVVTDADRVRGRVVLPGQFASIDTDLTARENLVLLARLLGHSWSGARRRADDLLAAFDLEPAAARQAKALSGGMRRRLDVAASLITTPDLLFLDEPTTGLDPRSRRQVWDAVRRLAADGTTVVLTTQYLDEADQLAHRVAVIDHGRLVAEGTSAALKASVGSGTLAVRLADPRYRATATRILDAALASSDGPAPSRAEAVAGTADEQTVVVTLAGGRASAPDASVEPSQLAAEAVAALIGAGVPVSEFSLGQPTLDEVFHALTSTRREEVPA
jgi:ABC-2 type transport system ATP-binding protein